MNLSLHGFVLVLQPSKELQSILSLPIEERLSLPLLRQERSLFVRDDANSVGRR